MTLYQPVKTLRKLFLMLQCLDTNISTVILDLHLANLEQSDIIQDSQDVAEVVSDVTMSGY